MFSHTASSHDDFFADYDVDYGRGDSTNPPRRSPQRSNTRSRRSSRTDRSLLGIKARRRRRMSW